MYVIAETGTNHNGNSDTALKLVRQAIRCGVQAVKMNYWDIDLLAAPKSLWYERGKKLQLPLETLMEAKEICDSALVDLIIAPFAHSLVEDVVEIADGLKIASGEITNHKLLKACAKTNLPIYMSTGMADLEEIDAAFEIAKPEVLMHCVSLYPTPHECSNLNRIDQLKEKYKGITIGYSDHTVGDLTCLAAASMGVKVLEKHFNLSDNPCADDIHSLTPYEMKKMIDKLYKIEEMKKGNLRWDIMSRKHLRRGQSGLRE